MSKLLMLSDGGKIEFTDSGVSIISSTGRRHEFDNSGNKASGNFIPHFDFMGMKEQEIVRMWVYRKKGRTKRQRDFLSDVRIATAMVTDEYYIANLEPSIDSDGRIYYKKGHKVCHNLCGCEWKKKAMEFAPEWKSDLATKQQLLLWYAYRIAMGFWTLSYVCDNSSSAGNYSNSPDNAGCFEVSGAREVGGARDGVGNTIKIVDCGDFGYGVFGGFFACEGKRRPVADFLLVSWNFFGCDTSGVIALNKVPSTFD